MKPVTLKVLSRNKRGMAQSRPVKVLQFGEGNFLRAFTAWVIDVMNEKTHFNAAIQIVQPIPQGMAHLVNAQDGLYHVLLHGIKNGKASKESRLITAVDHAINPYENYQQYLESGENPDLEFIISNTTEAGIAFEAEEYFPDKISKTFPGKLTSLLYHRYKHFKGAPDKGLVFFPCELIDKNGAALKETILQYVQHWGLPAEFKAWILNNNIFCNTLVDRIVPGFPKDSITEIQEEITYEDNLVVMAEPFHLWVIEVPEHARALSERFPAQNASLEVKFVSDLSPYRTRKVRILNGAHTALVPVAYLQGLRTVRESIEDDKVGKYIKEVIFEEIIPTLDLPEEELVKFSNDVIERFLNPYIKHELISISLNSISKFKVRVLPSLLEYKERKNQLPERLVMSLAALIVFYRGYWHGENIPLNDNLEILNFFTSVWENTDSNIIAQETLSNVKLWDQDLTKIEGLTKKTAGFIEQLLGSE